MKPSLKDNVLRELIATSQSGEVISGQNLAIKYSVSRNAIWKTIKALQADGYAIIAGKNRGYILEGNYDILSREDISARLADKVVTDIGIFVHDEIDSTNSEAKRLLTDGICEPFLVVADSQTAGRGRFGRSFYSPPGTGVYMTLVVSPEIETNAPVTITAAAAVAVCRVVKKLTGKEVQIKWVNDIFFGGRKICGILTEAVADMETGTFKHIIIGIGINLNTEDFPPELSDIAGSVGNSKLSRSELISEVTTQLLGLIENIQNNSFIDEYRERSCVVGKEIEFYKNGEKLSAFASDIDVSGGLVVTFSDGTTDILRSGEVSVRVTQG